MFLKYQPGAAKVESYLVIDNLSIEENSSFVHFALTTMSVYVVRKIAAVSCIPSLLHGSRRSGPALPGIAVSAHY
jgi:hypothetical protein